MTHAEACRCEGEYLLELTSIRATNDLDDSVIEALPWSCIEEVSGYCIDRSSTMPAGSVVNLGLGAQQRVFTEGELCAAQRARS